MIVNHESHVKGIAAKDPQAKDVIMKALVSPEEGWAGYVMRLFKIEAGGHTPKHAHPWPHINYIVSGQGILHLDGKEYEVEAGSFAYVPADKVHQFSNLGKEKFEFICIVPEEGHK